jgi:ABC-type glutathione transport system ATPase component
VPDLSVAENIFMGHELTLPGGRMNYPAMIHRAEALMRELKVPDMNVALPVSQYGGGYQQLVEIAKALNKQARLLILDEPSSALTRSEIEVLLDIIRDLKAKGVACVYISHKLDEVAAVCDTITVIRDGQHIATTAMADMDIPQIITQMVGREMSNLYPPSPTTSARCCSKRATSPATTSTTPAQTRGRHLLRAQARGNPRHCRAGRRRTHRTGLGLVRRLPRSLQRRSLARRPGDRHAHAAQIRSAPGCAWCPRTASARASFPTWAWARTSPWRCSTPLRT